MPTNKSGNRGRRRALLHHSLKSSRDKPTPPSPLAALLTASILLVIIILFPLALSFMPALSNIGPVGANAHQTSSYNDYNEERKPDVIAIDFGTTNSRIGKGYWEDGIPQVVGARVGNYVAFRAASTNGTIDMEELEGMGMGVVLAGELQGRGNGVLVEEQVVRNGEGGKRGAWRGEDGRGMGGWKKVPEGFEGWESGVEVLVGEEGRGWREMEGKKGAVVWGVRDLLGRYFADPELQKQIPHLPFKVKKDDSGPGTVIEVEIEDSSVVTEGTASKRVLKYTPEQITAIIFRELKDIAERETGEEVQDVVITAPLAPGLHDYAELSGEHAYDMRPKQQSAREYQEAYKASLEHAASLAGLNVVRFVKEPMAAAIAYGMHDFRDDVERSVLVYDLGATSLDVTVLLVDSGVFEVVGHERFEGTGGRKVDENVAEWILGEVASRMNSGGGQDGERESQLEGDSSMVLDPELVRKIKEIAEGIKMTLSEQEAMEIDLDGLLGNDKAGIDTNLTMTRKDFEDANHDLVENTLSAIRRVLSAANVVPWANVTRDTLDEVLVVGGSGKIPMVRRAVERFLKREEKPIREGTVDPAEAVFYGAVRQAQVLSGEVVVDWCGTTVSEVALASIGVETAGGFMATIIPRYKPIPTRKLATFTTSLDNQTSISLRIFQGERPLATSNDLLRSIKIDLAEVGKSNLPRGVPRITFDFQLDDNGDLRVFVNDTIETDYVGLHRQLIASIQTGFTNTYNKPEKWEKIQSLMDEWEKFWKEDEETRLRVDAKRTLAGVVNEMRRNNWIAEAVGFAHEDDLKATKDELKMAEVWLEEHGDVESTTAEEFMKQVELLFERTFPLHLDIDESHVTDELPPGDEGGMRLSIHEEL
ncbi:Hsp70 protein-domain-containing protein [Sordaria brevicollis]|uniref:Hsp70 protein-domain-containing protein n=1 Tax=Sordaria brevicollis TaxID=83679 RepID=A0AAE0PAS5_SORBR|nr:Hsp70 protein-domain-containing protein [Sordaria brevicollis]